MIPNDINNKQPKVTIGNFSQNINNQTLNFTLPPKCINLNITKEGNESLINDSYNLSFTLSLINENSQKIESLSYIGTNEEKANNKEIDTLLYHKNSNRVKYKIEKVDTYKNIEDKNNICYKQKLLGRKKKADNCIGEHNKFSNDNLIKKCKHLVINSIQEFINEKIQVIYNGNIGNNIFKKKLLTLNKEQKSNASTNYNKEFLNKKLGQIFSEKISSKFSNYCPEHNEKLIKILLNEKDKDKQNYFNNLFNLTFLQCLKHFRGSENIEYLNGLKCFKEIKLIFKDEKEYIQILEYYIMNLETIIMRKKSRNSKKKVK